MNRGEFTRAVFEKLHIPLKPSRLYFGVALAVMQDCEARNNPWGTKEPYPDSTDFNSAGVKNYKTWEDGVFATTSTLVLEYYKELVACLRDEKSTMGEMVVAFNASPWGGRLSLSLLTEVMDRYDFYNTEVVGSPKEAPKSTTALGLAPTTGDVTPTREDVLVDSDEGEEEVTEEEEVNAKAAAADASESTTDTPAVERRVLNSPVPVERRVSAASTAAVQGDVPAPTESDKLEDRLKKMYGDADADVRTDAEKVAADIDKVVQAVETQTTPGNMATWEARLQKVEAFVQGVTAVISKL